MTNTKKPKKQELEQQLYDEKREYQKLAEALNACAYKRNQLEEENEYLKHELDKLRPLYANLMKENNELKVIISGKTFCHSDEIVDKELLDIKVKLNRSENLIYETVNSLHHVQNEVKMILKEYDKFKKGG